MPKCIISVCGTLYMLTAGDAEVMVGGHTPPGRGGFQGWRTLLI